MMNSEEYKCYAFDVGAGPVSAQKNINKITKPNTNAVGAGLARPKEDKNNTNAVGAESISAQMKSHHAITLIALIITIIVMLILAGVVLNLTLGEHGIFKTAQNAASEYEKTKIKEEIELAVMDIEHEEIVTGNEITLEKIKEKLPGKLNNITGELQDNKITGEYKGYEYEIDNKFNVTIGKNNGTNIDEEETKGTLTISKDLQMWLDRANEKITLQDILEDETVGEVKGLIPILNAENVTKTEEDGIVKYTDITGGIVSASSEYGTNYPAYQAFNGIIEVGNGAFSQIGKAKEYWLEYAFPQNVKAIYAKVKLDMATQSSWERTMKIQAFNEEKNDWEDLIEERTYKVNGHNAPKEILALNSNNAYKRFRIYIPSIGNSTGAGADNSGVLLFQLYGIKTDNNSISNDEIEQKLISSSNINIELSNAVSMNSLMDRLMLKKETEDVILTNENIRNAVLESTIALSKTVRINHIVTEEDVTKITDEKYQDNLGNIMYSNKDSNDREEAYTWKAFDGQWIKEGWGDPTWWKPGTYSSSLIYEFTEPVLACKFKYQISAATSATYYRKFSVQASNDGENWVDLTLDHEMSAYRAITTFEEAATYNSNTIQKYKMFKICVKEKSGDIDWTAIGEFEIYGIK